MHQNYARVNDFIHFDEYIITKNKKVRQIFMMQQKMHTRENECLSIMYICVGPISCACVQAHKTKKNDDDRHTCAYLFIVVVHQLQQSLLTLFYIIKLKVTSDIYYEDYKMIRYRFKKKCLYNRYVNLISLLRQMHNIGCIRMFLTIDSILFR